MHAWKNQVRTVTGEGTKGGHFFFFFLSLSFYGMDSSVESIISGTKSPTQIHNLKGTHEGRDHWHSLEEGNYWGSRHSSIEKEAAMTHAMSANAICFCGGEHYRDKNAKITKATPLPCCSIYPKHYKRKGGENPFSSIVWSFIIHKNQWILARCVTLVIIPSNNGKTRNGCSGY